jgi:hypothetical protein
VGGCLIGGDPWFLVEDGVQNPLTEAAPKSRVELGGALPTPPPTPTFTPSPLPPTPTPLPTTLAPTQPLAVTIAPGATSPATAVAAAVTAPPTAAAPAPAATAPPTATPSAEELARAVRPRGFQAVMPYLLMGLGVLVIGGGAWFFLAGRRPAPAAPPAESEWVASEPDVSEPITRPSEPTDELPPVPPSMTETKPHKRPRRRKKSAPADDATRPSGFSRDELPEMDQPDDEPPVGPAFE